MLEWLVGPNCLVVVQRRVQEPTLVFRVGSEKMPLSASDIKGFEICITEGAVCGSIARHRVGPQDCSCRGKDVDHWAWTTLGGSSCREDVSLRIEDHSIYTAVRAEIV